MPELWYIPNPDYLLQVVYSQPLFQIESEHYLIYQLHIQIPPDWLPRSYITQYHYGYCKLGVPLRVPRGCAAGIIFYPGVGRITFPTIEGDIYYPKIET